MFKTQTDTPLEALRRVVKEHADTHAEIDRLHKLEPELKAERDSLIQSGKFEDTVAVSAASALDLKIRMLPHKVRQLEEYLASLDGPIGKAAAPVFQELRDQTQAILEDVNAEAREKVKNLGVSMTDLGFDLVADRVVCGSFIAAEIANIQMFDLINHVTPISFAKATLCLAPRVEALKRLADGKRLAWNPAKAA